VLGDPLSKVCAQTLSLGHILGHELIELNSSPTDPRWVTEFRHKCFLGRSVENAHGLESPRNLVVRTPSKSLRKARVAAIHPHIVSIFIEGPTRSGDHLVANG